MASTQETLNIQNDYYEQHLREKLERESFGKWAVVSNKQLVGVYDDNSEASEVALRLAPEQVCLVKHIGYVVGVDWHARRVTHVPVRHS